MADHSLWIESTERTRTETMCTRSVFDIDNGEQGRWVFS